MLVETGRTNVSAKDFESNPLKDVTDEFLKLTSELPLGTLALSPGFSLVEAMSAVELMDPKMDLGMKPLDKTLGLQYALENDHLNERNITLEELIAIYDASLACVASSIDGAFFDQTIYTNICLHNPEAIKDENLRVMSKGFLILTRQICYLIDIATIAFEEDHSYQRLRDPEPWKKNNLELINELKINYQRFTNSQFGTLEHAYGQRIKFLYSFFEALHYTTASPEVLSVDSSMEFEVNFKQAESSMEHAWKAFHCAKDSINQGLQPPSNANDSNFSWLFTFQPNVNQHLFSASFPKDTKLFSRKEGYEYLEKTLTFLKRYTTELPEQIKCIDTLLNYVKKISNMGADIFARSVLGLLIFPFNDHIFGKTPISELIITSMQSTVSPFILSKEYTFSNEVQEHWQFFLKDMSTFFIDLIQTFGMNLVRQRERIGPFMEEATNVYLKAEGMDRKVAEYLFPQAKFSECINRKPYPVSTFLALNIMELMSYYIELGFKLELFVDHELPYMYWYLGEVTALWRHRFWIKAKEYVDMERTFKPPDTPQKKFEKKKMQREATITRNVIEIEKNILKVKLQAAFCEVYFCLSAARVSSGTLSIPEGEQMRYSSRFEAFSHVPAFASCSYVKYMVESQFSKFIEYPPTFCYEKAKDAAQLCVEILSNLQHVFSGDPEIKAELDLAKRNKIACALLSKKPEIFDSLDFNKNYLHPLIVIKNQTNK